ncbi:MAG: DNA mismatch repair endonuclease MutL [Verrucomicrobiae bacterium]|nr:DNA mismatch repair endonuclease MutL [Verrucomicrobiae bacterium]
MNRIRVLSDVVANQIAAGEVVERPASVLKELVENAIDADARRLRVEIRGGGKSLVRVTDDGHGMSRDDALLCLERHATSKIHASADIGAIRTLGFRGEALPSIAAVSRFRLLTRESNAPAGVELDAQGGKLLAVREAGCATGTMVEVRNLFYNLPARRRFLRSDATELGHLHHVFLLHAIARPGLGWALTQDERVVHDLPPAGEGVHEGPEMLLARVKALYGSPLASQLVPVELDRGAVRLRGLTGKPGLSRSNRSELHCFVNRRPVDSRAIYYGLIEGYHNALMRGRYPVCFLFLEIDPELVDVNIHPAKREVRFREDARIQGMVIEAVRRALGRGAGARPQPLAMGLGAEPAIGAFAPPLRPSPPAPAPVFQPLLPSVVSPPSLDPPSPSGLPFPSVPALAHDVAILGVVANLYVVAVDAEGLLLVDQHAAHERVLYEQVMGRLDRGPAPSQHLLLPQTVELPPRDAVELRAQMPLLERMGFGIAEFGDRSFLVDALPPFLGVEAVPQLLRSLVDDLAGPGAKVNRARFAEETVAKTVCRHAVKANDALRAEELARLIRDLRACAHPLTCPHGRPTMLRLTLAELERRFGRRPG